MDQHNLEQKKEEQEAIAEGERCRRRLQAGSRPSTVDAVADEGVGRARTDESIKREGAVPGAPRLVHPLLMKENLLLLLQWLIDRLRIVEYRRAGEDRERHRLILEYELEEVAVEKAAMSLQGLWKMMQSR